MAYTFLRTKLCVPTARPDWIERHRLIQRLNDGLTRQVTLLSAPAGYGKTALVVSWLNQLDAPVAWLALDDGDNDPVLFLTYLVAALQNVYPALGEGLTDAFKTPQPIDLEPVLAALVNQIFSISHRVILVFEDYHCLTAQIVHKALGFLLDHQPTNLHLVITTRMDSLLPLARLRGRGQITEIRQDDLRFTVEEAEGIFSRVANEDLNSGEILTLVQRTEGWITGLQLAALSLRVVKGKEAALAGFSGRDALVADYLANEVIRQLPENIYTFLLKTSILDRLSGALCEAVTGQSDGQKILQWLLDANLFVISLDNQQAWYRYHQLFADLLQSRLFQSQPALVSTLHLRASQWYETEGFIDKAIDYALAAGDFHRAAKLVEGAAEVVLMEGRVATFKRWAKALPEEVSRKNSVISVYLIFLQVWQGTSPAEILEQLEEVERIDDGGTVAGEITLIRAFIGLDREQRNLLSQHALALLPLDRTYFRGFATAYYGAIQVLNGELELARQSFSEVVRTSRRAANTFLTVLGLCRLADIAMLRGQLHEAEAAFRQALQEAKGQRGETQPLAGEPLIGLGRVHYERNELGVAKECLTEGIKLANILGETKTLIAHITLAHIWLMEGETQLAHQAMLQAQLIAENSTNAEIHLPVYRANKVRFELLQGDVEAAFQWAGRDRIPRQGARKKVRENIRAYPFPLLHVNEILSLATLRSAQGRWQAALDILDPLLEVATQAGWAREALWIQVQRALAFKAMGEAGKALDCLGKALSAAEPEGYVRPFVEQGRPMFELLRQAEGHHIQTIFVQGLLAAFRHVKVQVKTRLGSASAQPLVVPLTTREVEVVRLLAEGHSNREIAERLVVSPGTVKKHLDSIYEKLGAHNRTEAVAGARELGFL